MGKFFAAGAGFYWLYAAYHHGGSFMMWFAPLVVVFAAYFAGRGVRWKFGSTVANAVASATAAARSTSNSNAAAVAQGGSVTVNVYQPTDVDQALGYDRQTFLDGLRGTSAVSLQSHGIDVTDGIPYLVDELPDELPVRLDPPR